MIIKVEFNDMTIENELLSLAEIESQIERRIKEFNNKREYNERKNRTFSSLQLALAALSTLLVAISLKYQGAALPILGIIANSCAMYCTSVLDKFMYKTRMVEYLKTVCELYELKYTITMHKRKEEDYPERKITLEDIERYQDQYQEILNRANSAWRINITGNKSDSDNKNP